MSGEVKVGDRIKSVDGVDCENKDLASVLNLTSGAPKALLDELWKAGDAPSASMLLHSQPA